MFLILASCFLVAGGSRMAEVRQHSQAQVRTGAMPQVTKSNDCDVDGCVPPLPMWQLPYCRAKCAWKTNCSWDGDEGCEYRGGSLLQVRTGAMPQVTKSNDCDVDGCVPPLPMWQLPYCRAKCAWKTNCKWDLDEGCE
ncbi:unnamed protein product [Effrenium voratum]|uniref:Uncharacterized protein n=1 Tax=Effrenium voratum TaxID=2562239 RepID=A0AA36HN86_9DINO|nr:unnamed protein product [Effrenium voratum]CAJ1427180.1 unnamed protein product [Effrenium voratum]